MKRVSYEYSDGTPPTYIGQIRNGNLTLVIPHTSDLNGQEYRLIGGLLTTTPYLPEFLDPVDGIPREIHEITDPEARFVAYRAYAENLL